MSYEWDPAKSASNRRKHGVDFADAVIALEDDRAVTMEDPDSEQEARFVSLGMDPMGRILVTIFTHRDDKVRIISSRKATKAERSRYEEAK